MNQWEWYVNPTDNAEFNDKRHSTWSAGMVHHNAPYRDCCLQVLESPFGPNLYPMSLGLLRGMLGFKCTVLIVNMAQIIKSLSDKVSDLIGLADENTEMAELRNDRTVVGGGPGMTMVDQSGVTAAKIGVMKREVVRSAVDKPGSIETQSERFFLIGCATWEATKRNLERLEFKSPGDMMSTVATFEGDVDIFACLFNAALSVHGNLKYHAMARCGMEIVVQANPTPQQLGCLLIACAPGSFGTSSVAGHCCLPHGFINANINNSIRLSLPWINARGMRNLKATTTVNNPTPWVLRATVISQLAVSDTTSATIDVFLYARFTSLELHGLNPLSNIGQTVNISANFNVINMCNDSNQDLSLNMGAGIDSWSCDPGTAMGCKLQSLREWCQVPGLIGQFNFQGGTHTPGDVLVSLPVSPFMQTLKVETIPVDENVSGALNTQVVCTTPIASICSKFCYWRGDLNVHLQVVGTRFHGGRIIVSFYPESSPGNSEIKKKNLGSPTSTLCATFDINGVGSTMCFRIPWVSTTPWKPNPNVVKEAKLPVTYYTGALVVKCLNRLTYPKNVPAFVRFNMWLSSDNIECMAPLYSRTPVIDLVATAGELEESGGFDSASYTTPIEQKVVVDHPDKGEDGIPVGAVTTMEDPLLEKKKVETFPEDPMGAPLHKTDHMDLQVFFSRAYYYDTFAINQSEVFYSMPISLSTRAQVKKNPYYIWRWAASLWHLLRGPLKIILTVEGEGDVDCIVTCVPVGAETISDDSVTQAASVKEISGIFNSTGCVHWNTWRTDTIQIKVPWYSPFHGITGRLKPESPETVFARLLFYFKNLNVGKEKLRVNVYISFTNETEVFFMTPPCSDSHLSDFHPIKPLGLDYEPNSLDDWLDDQDREEESRASELRTNVIVSRDAWSRRPYRDLRMQVGAHRLVNAHEELGTYPKAQSDDGRIYAQAGDAPKGKLETGEIVTANDGGWQLRGIYVDEVVYYADCSPRMCSGFSQISSGYTAKCDVRKYNWVSTGLFANKAKAVEWAKKFRVIYFDYPLFERGDIRGAFHNEHLNEEFVDFFKNMVVKQKKYTSKMVDDTEAATKLRMASENVSRLADECQKFINDVRAAVTAFEMGLQKRKRTIVSRIVYAVVKASLSIFVCHKSEWKFSVVAGVFAMIGMDVAQTAMSVHGILDSMFEEIAQHVGLKKVPTAQSLGLRDISTGLAIIKNLKDILGWVISAIKTWYEGAYGDKKQILQFLDDQKEVISLLIGKSDELCTATVPDVDRAGFVNECVEAVKELRTLLSMCIEHDDLKPFVMLLKDSISSLQRKIISLGAVREQCVNRPEPVVIYLYGNKGSGKSMASMCLAIKICKLMGLDHMKNIYTKPVGAEFWDGYSGQAIVLVDDIGQNTDDESWSDFCQIVSTAPMRLDMADLSSKGQHFSSPIIICTSNLADPQPKTVYCPEAIQRRLHYKVLVSPIKECTKTLSCGPVLDVRAAEAMGLMQNMQCCSFLMDGQDVTIPDLASIACHEVQDRQTSMIRFMNLWAQGDSQWTFLKVHNGKPSGKLDQVWNCVDGHVAWMVGSVVGVLAIVASIYGLSRLFKKTEQEVLVENRAYTGTTKPKAVVELSNPTVSQSTLEIANVVHHNICRFGVEQDGTVHWVLNCLGVFGNWVLVPHHSYAYDFDKEEDPLFYIQRNATYYSVRRSSCVVVPVDSGTNDLVLICIPKIPPFKDIRHHFVPEENLKEANGHHATLATVNNGVFQMISEGEVKFEDTAQYVHRTRSGKETNINVGGCWRGSGFTYPGSCGGALITASTKLQNAIIGIHVAAGGGAMIASAVTREMLNIVDDQAIRSQRVLAVQFVSERCNVNCKTEFKPSPIYDWVPSKRAPSAMPYIDKRPKQDPVAMVIAKFNIPIVMEPPLYSVAVLYMQSRLLEVLSPIDHRPLTIKEAIEGTGAMEGIDMNTSPGLPYVLHGLKKKDLISGGVVVHRKLANELENTLLKMDRGADPMITYQTSFKDELRDYTKVESGNTRVIEGAPVHYVIAVRAWLGRVYEAILSNPGFGSMCAIGIDPEQDWHPMIKELIHFGGDVVAIDFTKFDGSVQPFMLERAITILCVLAGVSGNVCQSLVSSFMVTRRQIGDMVITAWGGVPSGCPMTSILDSIINAMNTVYVIHRYCGVPYEQINEKIRLITYGDDILLSTRGHLDLGKLKQGYLDLGMFPTGPDKSSELQYQPLSEATFLKRHWVVDPRGLIHPVIDKESVMGLLKWKRKGAKFCDNIYNACAFMYHYGEEEYWNFVFWLRDLLLMARLEMQLPMYEHFDKRFVCLPHYRPFI